MKTKDDVLELSRHDLADDVRGIIEDGLRGAFASVEQIALVTYWRVGRRVVEEIKQGADRAEYGKKIVSELAKKLRFQFGGHYSKRNLDYYCQFYRLFPDFEIVNARVHNLRWTHYRELLSVTSDDARYWYLREASREGWSARTLARNVGSQYYQRLLASPKKEAVVAEMMEKTAANPPTTAEMLKSPVVAEFLNLTPNSDYTESDLEKAIISHISRFIMELGRGFSFVARQQHIATDCGDFYIDLVFYNYILKCFFLIDLKTTRLTHQDVGQIFAGTDPANLNKNRGFLLSRRFSG